MQTREFANILTTKEKSLEGPMLSQVMDGINREFPQYVGANQELFQEWVVLFRFVLTSYKKIVGFYDCEHEMCVACCLPMCLQGVLTKFSLSLWPFSRHFPTAH